MPRHWTDEIDAEADVLYRTFTEAKIRRYQDLCTQQIGMAHKARATDALHDLRRMENALSREMLRRCMSGVPELLETLDD